ncbi:hypothetical protein ACFLW1_00870 [Chloroflexota bacterium]
MQGGETTSESTVKGRTIGAFRCLNCFNRVSPPAGAKEYKCPHCNYEWRVAWVNANVPRIRGPVWDVDKKMADEEYSKMGKGGK